VHEWKQNDHTDDDSESACFSLQEAGERQTSVILLIVLYCIVLLFNSSPENVDWINLCGYQFLLLNFMFCLSVCIFSEQISWQKNTD